jgi:hypothetical protein
MLETTELTGQDELFLMSNLFPEDTGLPFIVWVSVGEGVRHDVRVKVYRGGKVNPREMTSVALRPTVHVTQGEGLSGTELKALAQWIELNYDVILKYWNMEISTRQMLDSIKKVEPEAE